MYIDFDNIKDFIQKDFLLKEIANCKMPICLFYMRAKQVRKSITSLATKGFIELSNLKSGNKVSSNYYISRE